MIAASEIMPIGKLYKTHGIKGEITAGFDFDIDVSSLKCIVLDVDGIYVPFFITSVRPKNADSDLLTIEGIESEEEASKLVNKTIYALNSDMEEYLDDDDDRLYADDLVGYAVNVPEENFRGTIVDVDDTTDNTLLIVAPADNEDEQVYIPLADDFITDIDEGAKCLTMSLPTGLLTI